jgi:hypothetical protein
MFIFNNQRGQALLLTMLAVTIIFFSSTSYLYIAHNTRVDSILHRDKLQAYYVAEAGIEMALARLLQDDNWHRWQQDFAKPISFAGGSIKKLGVETLVAKQQLKELEIKSVGVYQQAQKTLVVKVRLEMELDSDEISMQIISWRGEYPVFYN